MARRVVQYACHAVGAQVLIRRVAALVLLAPFLTFASALAPQHVHQAGPGHEHPIAHSHFSPHEVGSAASALHDGDEIEADLEHVVWIDSSAIHELPFRVDYAPANFTAPFGLARPATESFARDRYRTAPAHGPPTPVWRLRGPPSLV